MVKKLVMFSLILCAIHDIFSLNYISIKENAFDWQYGRLQRLQLRTEPGVGKVLQLSAFDQIENLDLLLNFENKLDIEKYPYTLTKEGGDVSHAQFRTGSSAVSFNLENVMSLRPLSSSIFSEIKKNQDFTISFWINPSRLADGEIIFSYYSPLSIENRYIHQSITAFVVANQVIWRFENVFFNEEGESILIELAGESILRNMWSHHAVSFDSSRGFLQLLNNNTVVNTAYTNKTNNAERFTSLPYFQYSLEQEIHIGQFLGYMDGFFIARQFMDRVPLDYFNRYGYFISQPIFIYDKILDNIEVDDLKEDFSALRLFIRTHDSAKFLNDLHDDKDWQEIDLNTFFSIQQKNPRYMQLRVNFFAGKQRQSSPVLRDIKLFYYLATRPSRPGNLYYQKESENILKISWQPVLASNIAGYRLYFGTDSGEYVGRLGQVFSPIDVETEHSVLLHDLTPGVMYYISLVSYDDQGRESEFSPELVILF